MKKINLFNKVLITLIIIFLLILSIFFIRGYSENTLVNQEINDFKSLGVKVFSDEINKIEFYEIEKEESSRTFSYQYLYDDDKSNDYFGDVGDITITDRNPLGDYPFGEMIAPVVKLLNIGHATINYYGNQIIESEGKYDKVVSLKENTWLEIEGYNHIIGLKVKTTEEVKTQAIMESYKMIGQKYNWDFLISKENKKYCLDLISASYDKVNIDLNSDKWYVTGNDLILSSETYIYYFQEKVYNTYSNSIWTRIYYIK